MKNNLFKLIFLLSFNFLQSKKIYIELFYLIFITNYCKTKFIYFFVNRYQFVIK